MSFRESYKRANDRLHAEESTLAAIKRRAAGEKGGAIYSSAATPKRWSITAASVVLAAAVALAVLIPAVGGKRVIEQPKVVPAAQIQSAQDYDHIYSVLNRIYEERNSYTNYGITGAMDDSLDGATEVGLDTVNEVYNGPRTGPTAVDAPAAEEKASTDAAAAETASGSPEHSETNVQVKGVDEGDIIKNDGKYIYILRRGTVTIVDAADMKELTSFAAEFEQEEGRSVFPYEMYVQGDRLVVLFHTIGFTPIAGGGATVTAATAAPSTEIWREEYVTKEKEGGFYEEQTLLTFFDIADPAAPKQLCTLSQSGGYISSRLIDGCLYTVSSYSTYEPDAEHPETFVPNLRCDGKMTTMPANDICLPEEVQAPMYTVVTSVKLGSCESFAGQKAVLGGHGTVYADADSLLVAYYKSEYTSEETKEGEKNVVIDTYTGSTALTLFALHDGAIENTASGKVPGNLLNQFSMDEHKGYYRIVTTLGVDTHKIYTDGRDYSEYESYSTNGLYVLDGGLNIVGKLDGLAEDERVYSVRFDGDMGYFVTFRQVDPLFAVDLSDPTAPTLRSALKIPGFSQYMHKYGEGSMFGLGMDADEETGRTNGMKLSMFDISDPANVTERHTLKLSEETGWSEALYNHKAILISKELNIIAFPIDGNGYAIFGYDEQAGFAERARISTDAEWHDFFRGLFIGDRFYVCSDAEVMCYSLTDFSQLGRLQLSELPEQEFYIFK